MSKELLFSVTKKDFEIHYFSGSGAGGQHRNKHSNCVRLHHPDSGVRATGQRSKDRQTNLRDAFRTLTTNATFKIWMNQKTQEYITGQSIKEKIHESVADPYNLKVECRDISGKWGTYDDRST